MTSDKFDNLIRIGQLKAEPPRTDELDGLFRSGRSRLADATRADLAYESRFDLAYNAAHALALHALRQRGYRPRHRYIVFQLLPETTGMSAAHWRVLAKAHEQRNLAEYEGYLETDEQLLKNMLEAIHVLLDKLKE